MNTILIFAGGDRSGKALLDDLPTADHVIAADSGHHNAIALGLDVDVIVGDFDSISPDVQIATTTEIVPYPEDKDFTDLELAFELAARLDPRRIVLVGAEGGRFDHELGAISLLGSPRWAAVPEIEWVRSDAHLYLVRGTVRIQGDPGSNISLFAVGGDALGVSTTGLAWELSSEALLSGSSRGVSNQFQKSEATIQVEGGAVLAVIPNAT
jgi:thiamine pyrophosphokinase